MRIFIYLYIVATLFNASLAQEAKPINLGQGINSEHSELVPVISPDGQTLYFTRRDHPGNVGERKDHHDIWFAQLQADSTWGEAQNIGDALNNEEHNFVSSVTPDGNTLLLAGYYDQGDYVKKGYSLTHRTKDGWSPPQGLDIEKYETMDKGKYSNAWLGNDGRTLILSFSATEGEEDGDIYVSFLQEDGSWSCPKSLGEGINTTDDEGTPFLASDGVTLYFSSNRPGNLGQNDIYVSKREDDSWQKWSLPKRLAPPVNTTSWDAYYAVPAAGDHAYIVSYNDSHGQADIFKVKLAEEFRPDPVVLVYGKVFNAETKEPISASIVYEEFPEGKEIGTARSNPSDGSYKIVLKQGKKYGFSAESSDYFAISENLNLEKVGDYQKIEKDLYLVPIAQGEVIRLNNLFFDMAQSKLRPASFSDLNRLAGLMETYPEMRIELQGHTDSVGAAESNQELSELRAKACAEYLIEQGINAERIRFKGWGENQPIANNDLPEGRQLNRRVEFKILEK